MADQLIRAMAAEGGIRAVGVITTRLTEEARQRHKLSWVASVVLGRTMAAGLLLASSMKTPKSRVNIRVQGNGPLGEVLVDAGLDGTVRGYVNNPTIELLPNKIGKHDIGKAVGNQGYLYIVRDIGYGYPYSGTVELVSGEIGDDITHYLAKSEQTPSALVLGVFVDKEGVQTAGGILLQVMPKVAIDEELVQVLESRIASLSGFTSLLHSGKTLPEIFQELLGDMGLNILPEAQIVRFKCDCSMEKVLRALRMFGVDELQNMIEEDKGAEVTCEFCSQLYQASPKELTQIIQDLQQPSTEDPLEQLRRSSH